MEVSEKSKNKGRKTGVQHYRAEDLGQKSEIPGTDGMRRI